MPRQLLFKLQPFQRCNWSRSIQDVHPFRPPWKRGSSILYLQSLSTTPSVSQKKQEASSSWRVAIVGSGPSGFYTAKYLQAAASSNDSPGKKPRTFQVDILERLPTAFGLVRNGVAPDHPEVKNVQHDFEALMSGKHDPDTPPRIRFFGNVHVGKDVSLEELRKMYDMVVLAYGCESDRSLQIPGANSLEGVLSAREFVAWYNGHVDFEWVGPVVQKALEEGASRRNDIVVLGHGNVALDCARILAKSRDELDPTDISSRALDILHPVGEDRPRKISIVGRRGHVQGAFTIKELRELTKLENADFIVRQDELEMGLSTEASQKELEESRPRTRMHKLLSEAATKSKSTSNTTEVHLRFLLNPISFESSSKDELRLGRVVCARTKLEGEAGTQQAEATGDEEVLNAQLALVSIGYKGVAIAGTEPWFDEVRGVLRNSNGLVDGPSEELGGLYTSGWLKRGPSGIIGTNIPDARDTVATMLHDVNSSSPKPSCGQTCLDSLLRERGVAFVDWEAYRRIDAEEMEECRKRHPEQPREKITDPAELLRIAITSS